MRRQGQPRVTLRPRGELPGYPRPPRSSSRLTSPHPPTGDAPERADRPAATPTRARARARARNASPDGPETPAAYRRGETRPVPAWRDGFALLVDPGDPDFAPPPPPPEDRSKLSTDELRRAGMSELSTSASTAMSALALAGERATAAAKGFGTAFANQRLAAARARSTNEDEEEQESRMRKTGRARDRRGWRRGSFTRVFARRCAPNSAVARPRLRLATRSSERWRDGEDRRCRITRASTPGGLRSRRGT